MSRIAYLISAYKDAPQLARLVRALEGEADFYVHIDLNADEAPFRRLLDGRAVFVPRHRVSWGGWQQVCYQRELLAAALHSGTDYDRYVCLSGQDYPLWSNAAIRRLFDRQPQTEFIMGMNLATATDAPRQQQKVTRYHLFRDLPLPNLWLKHKLIVASRLALGVLPLRKPPRVRIDGQWADVYFGSDYWALTAGCARHVLHTLQTCPTLERYFRTSFVPSELCVQTIVFNSPYAPHALHWQGPYPGLWRLTPLHYIDYHGAIKVLTEADRAALVQSGKMFCRKVASGTSDGLMDWIDAHRRE